MTSPDSLGNAGGSTGEREGSDRVGSEGDVERLGLELLHVGEHVGSIRGLGAEQEARGGELQSRDLDADLELLLDVGADGREEGTSGGEDDESARLGDLEVDGLARWRVGGICR